jgi:hypothetical protein
VALGRTPPWAVGGLLFSLANQPFSAPSHPIATPDVIERTQISAQPPALMDPNSVPSARSGTPFVPGLGDRHGAVVASCSATPAKSADQSSWRLVFADFKRAKRRLRQLPLPARPPPELLPTVGELVRKQLPQVEDALALLREDSPGHRIVVLYVTPMGTDRAAVLATCRARLPRDRQPVALVVMPAFPYDFAAKRIQLERFEPPAPFHYVAGGQQHVPSAAAAAVRAGAEEVLRSLGNPTAHRRTVAGAATANGSSTCAVQ